MRCSDGVNGHEYNSRGLEVWWCILCMFNKFPLFAFLSSLSQALSSSVIHTPSCSRTPPFHSLIHTHFMQLECQWGPRRQNMQQCNSLSAVDPCQEEIQMLQQQLICWLCSQLNYRKQSRFVAVIWEDFYGVNIHRMHNNKWQIMYTFTVSIKVKLTILFSNAALFAQIERLCLINFNT